MAALISIFLLFSSFAHAADNTPAAKPIKLKILKSQKGKALIIHTGNVRLQPGHIYYLQDGPPKVEAEGDQQESRGHVVGLDFNAAMLNQTLTPLSTSSAATTTSLKNYNLNLLYGWNWESFESGPYLSYSFSSTSGVDAKTLSGGLFFDWNFSKNDGNSSGMLGLRFAAGMASEDNSAYSGAGYGLQGQGGLFYKWFGLSTTFAVVSQVAYSTESVKWQDAKIDRSGMLVKLGIQNYF